jgi:hypothetical protein
MEQEKPIDWFDGSGYDVDYAGMFKVAGGIVAIGFDYEHEDFFVSSGEMCWEVEPHHITNEYVPISRSGDRVAEEADPVRSD